MSIQIGLTALAAVLCVGACLVDVQAETPAIVISPDADQVEHFAAEEMQRYLEKITGEKVPISAQAPVGATGLFVGGRDSGSGRAKLGEEGYTLRSMDEGLLLAGGGPRGTLYAVYHFLERLGCRWYFVDPQDEIVPRLSLADVVRVARSGVQVEEKPDFSVRMYRFLVYDLGPEGTPVSDAIMKTLPEVTDWTAKNRMNVFQYAIDHNQECYAHWHHYRDVFPEMRKRGLIIGVGGHCLFMFMPSQAFEEHPDWLPMVKGKRSSHGQFCTRNESAVRFYIDNLIRFLKDNPEIEYFAPWPNDAAGWCECPLCRNTPSADRFMELGCRIYKELKRAVPHVRVTHFAYGSHVAPPETARPLPGMTVTLCTWGRDLAVSFSDAGTRQDFRSTFTSWRDLTGRAGVPLILHEKYARHLGLGFHPLGLPILQRDCRWFRRQGLAGFELPSAYMGRRTKSFNLHLLARLMWDADTDVEVLVNDYFSRCYAESAGPMRQAYQQVEQAQRDLRYWAHNYSQTLAGHPPGQKYSQEVCTYTANAVKHLARARRYVEQALGASRDDAVQGRIDRFAQSLAYLHLEWQALECLIEAADHVALADTAGDSPAGDKELEAAELKLKAARKLSRRRQELAARAPGCGLYWDVTGSGPAKVFKASQIDGWFDLVARRRR